MRARGRQAEGRLPPPATSEWQPARTASPGREDFEFVAAGTGTESESESESESATYSVDSSTISNEDETSGWLDPLDLELLDEILQREEKQQHKINVEAADLLFSENDAYTNANASIGLDLTQIDSIDWEMANACFGSDMPSANGFTTTLASQLSCGLRRLLGQFRYFRYYWAVLSLVCMGAATLYASYLDSRRFSHPRVVLQF